MRLDFITKHYCWGGIRLVLIEGFPELLNKLICVTQETGKDVLKYKFPRKQGTAYTT